MSATVPSGSITLAEGATEGVLGRRLVAWLIDLLILGVITVVLWLLLGLIGLVTFGIGWALFGLIPLVPFAYAWLFLATPEAATPGQRLMGLTTIHHVTGRRPTPLEAFVSTALYLILLTMLAPVLLLALVTPRSRAPQDILSGLLMVRKQTLTVNGGAWNISDATNA